MTPLTIRHFWQLIDRINLQGLSSKQDVELVPLLVQECRKEPHLDAVETTTLNTYISVRLPLIRDLLAMG
ncbi:MAG: hypothetical protein AAFY57_04350 [Cyanobacteria bacterium J06642_2]